MRLAVSKAGFYQADFYCSDSRSAKKILNERQVSIVAIDFYLVGRDTGCDFLRWGLIKNLLPSFVVITERDRNKRIQLANTLCSGGYRSADNTTFIKH